MRKIVAIIMWFVLGGINHLLHGLYGLPPSLTYVMAIYLYHMHLIASQFHFKHMPIEFLAVYNQTSVQCILW